MWFRFSDIYRQYTIFGENGQLNSLPKSHHMLHSKTYKRYADPAAKTCEDWFRACFYKVNDICIQPDRRHSHDDQKFAQFLKRTCDCGRKVEYCCYDRCKDEKKQKEREGLLEAKRRAFFFFLLFFPDKKLGLM